MNTALTRWRLPWIVTVVWLSQLVVGQLAAVPVMGALPKSLNDQQLLTPGGTWLLETVRLSAEELGAGLVIGAAIALVGGGSVALAARIALYRWAAGPIMPSSWPLLVVRFVVTWLLQGVLICLWLAAAWFTALGLGQVGWQGLVSGLVVVVVLSPLLALALAWSEAARLEVCRGLKVGAALCSSARLLMRRVLLVAFRTLKLAAVVALGLWGIVLGAATAGVSQASWLALALGQLGAWAAVGLDAWWLQVLSRYQGPTLSRPPQPLGGRPASDDALGDPSRGLDE